MMQGCSIERARAAMALLEQEWEIKQARLKVKGGKVKPVILYDKAKKGNEKMFKGTINDWRYIGEPGKRQVQGFISDHPSGQDGEIVTSPIIEYDHVTGMITTKSGNRYRLGSPEILS